MEYIKKIVRRATEKQKKYTAVALCAFVVVLIVSISLGQEEDISEIQGATYGNIEAPSFAENTYQLNISGACEDNCSQTVKTEQIKEQGNRVIQDSMDDEQEQTNLVKPVPSTVPALLSSTMVEEHGGAVNKEKCAIAYQYPTELGFELKGNFDRKQKKAGLVRRFSEEVQPEGQDDFHMSVVSGSAVSNPEASNQLSYPVSETVPEIKSESVSAVSGAAVSGTAISGGEQQNQVSCPQVITDTKDLHVLSNNGSNIYVSNEPTLSANVVSGSSVVEKVACAYGDKISYVTDPEENPNFEVELPDDFYGKVVMYGVDTEGNASDELSETNFLTEQSKPIVCFTDSMTYTAPYELSIDVMDVGHIVSGIDTIRCWVNGEEYSITNSQSKECIQLNDDIQVLSKAGFSVTLGEVGEYTVCVEVTDNAGNVTKEEKHISVTKPELVAVYTPANFTIHIDPQQLKGKEQIYSDEIILKNVGDVDAEVTVTDIDVNVNSEVSEDGIKKDCKLYLVDPNTGEKVPLHNGKNKNVCSYRLSVDEGESVNSIKFVGEISKGSDRLWKGEDITINVKFRFDKWKS